MQNRYVGDVGDFGKYGLLRTLTASSKLQLAVLWYLYPDEAHNGDGRHLSYLAQPAFENLDPQLHHELRDLISAGKRSIAEVQRRPVLPSNTIYVDAALPGENAARSEIPLLRREWLLDALARTQEADIAFFDPDNGIETRSVPMNSRKGGKYVFWGELEPFWKRGQSLVIYHHLNRTAPIEAQTKALREKFRRHFPDAGLVAPLLFRRGSCRHFWLIGQGRHSGDLQSGIEVLLASDWSRHFCLP